MAAILCLDVDGAPFVAFEMLALLERGHDVAFAGCREIPERLKSGPLEPLRERELRVSWAGRQAMAAAASFLRRRPARLIGSVAVALAAHRREPMALVKLLATLGWTLALAREAERRGITHVHGNWAHLPATSAWLVARLIGVPFSFSAHAGRDLFRTTAMLDRKLDDAVFAAACNGAAVARLAEISPGAGGKIQRCPHGVDLERFTRRTEEPTGDPALLSVGNLEPAKGFDVALGALAILRRERRPLRWRVVGEGPERPQLEALAARLGVGDVVDFVGRRDGEALVEEYRRATMLLVPSRILPNGGRDGLPNVILEAMGVGVPVVASGVAAIPEIVEDRVSGRLVAPDNPGALASAVRALLVDSGERRRLAAAAHERVSRDFDRRRTVEHFCELFGPGPRGEARGVV